MPNSARLLSSLALLAASALSLPAVASPRTPTPDELARGLAFLTRLGELAPADYDRVRARANLAPRESVELEPMRCGTELLVTARRWARQNGLQPRAASPSPGDFTLFVESTSLPNLRVYFQDESLRDESTRALGFMEETWQKQVGELGYAAPYTQTETGAVQGLYAYMVAGGEGWAGLTRPQIDVPGTPRCDCAVDVELVYGMGDRALKTTVMHEFNHATQAATDCGETISAWENFAAAVEFELTDRDDRDVLYMISSFQSFPEYPLDYWTQGYSDQGTPTSFYQYGASLFPLYLRDRFGPDDPTTLRKVWESFMQDGTYISSYPYTYCDAGNNPDWFQGLDAFLHERGSDLRTAYSEFAVWRAIVGTNDDGHHFRVGQSFAAPRMRIIANALPVHAGVEMHEYGSRYLNLMPDPKPKGIQLDIDCDPEASWSASFLLWKSGQPVETVPVPFTGGVGTLALEDMSDVRRTVLVISQLQDDSHHTDDADWEMVRTCSYDLKPLGVAPSADAGTTPAPATEASAAASSGCSCTEAGSAAPLAGLGLFALAAALRRRKAPRA